MPARASGSLRERARGILRAGAGRLSARAAAEPGRIASIDAGRIGRSRSPHGFSNYSRHDHGFPERRFAALAARRAKAHARRARGRSDCRIRCCCCPLPDSARSNWRIGSPALRCASRRARGRAAHAPPACCCARTATRIRTSCGSRKTRSRSRSTRCAALIESLSLKSYRGGYKVGVIEGAESLNANGANAFLKTLEEPTANTLLILIARPSHRLPATIASRCLRLTLAPPRPPMARRARRGCASAARSSPAQHSWDAPRSRWPAARPCWPWNWMPRAWRRSMRTCSESLRQLAAGSVDVTLLADRWMKSDPQLRLDLA